MSAFFQSWLKAQSLVAGVLAFVLAIYPQAGATLIGIVGFFNRSLPIDRFVVLAVLGWSLTRIIFHWRSEDAPLIGILEGIFAWLLYLGAASLSTVPQRRITVLGIALGLFVATVIGVIIPLAPGWGVGSAIVKSGPLSATLRVLPTDIRDEYVSRILDIRRPGRLIYTVEVRTDKPHRLTLLISSPAVPNRFAPPATCDANRIWKECSISANIPGAGVSLFIVGGFGSWKRGDPAVELRNPHVVEGGVATLFERLTSLPRISGLSINPNIFGGSAAVLAAMAFMVAPTSPIQLFVGGIAFIAVVLSGSRTAMIALIFAVTASVALYFRGRSVWMVFIGGLALLAAIQFGGLSTLLGRVASGYEIEQTSNLQRLYQLEMAHRAFLQSPWLGMGDLHAYFVDHLDDQGHKLGLTPSTLAHAHNLVLQTAGESGILGLVGLTLIWSVVISRVIRRRDYGGMMVLVVIALTNTFDYLFYYSSVQVAFWAVAAGIGFQSRVPPKDSL